MPPPVNVANILSIPGLLEICFDEGVSGLSEKNRSWGEVCWFSDSIEAKTLPLLLTAPPTSCLAFFSSPTPSRRLQDNRSHRLPVETIRLLQIHQSSLLSPFFRHRFHAGTTANR